MSDRIGVHRIFHTIHAVKDIHATREKYMNVFGAWVFAEGYHGPEDRDMNLFYVANHIVEPMAPRTLEATDKMLARYVQRHGEGFQSIEFEVDNAIEAAQTCRDKKVTLTTAYDTFFFVHPKSSGGVILEVCDTKMPNDPHDLKNWNPDWIEGHPSSLRRLSCIGCAVKDLAVAKAFFTEVWDGEIVHEDESHGDEKLRRSFIRFGDDNDTLCLAQPTTGSGPVSRYMEERNPGVYSIVWQVDDLAQAEDYFRSKELNIVRDGAMEGSFSIDPADMFGARHEFTDQSFS